MVKVHSEEEVQQLVKVAAQLETPVTFRAAGTSLSGQVSACQAECFFVGLELVAHR